jgi:hypothetical protein
MNTRFCKHCDCDHPLTEEFWYITVRQKGRRKGCTEYRCKEFTRRSCRAYSKRHPDRKQATGKKYRQTHQREIIEYHRKHKEQKRATDRLYYQNNRDKILQQMREYGVRNKEAKRAYYRNRYHEKKADIQFKLKHLLRSRLRSALINNGKRHSSKLAEKFLGCQIDQFQEHIESLFETGMSWDNWSKHGWHIDHKIPLSSFDLTNENELRKACHYTNLQPLWAKENLSKGAKVDEPA